MSPFPPVVERTMVVVLATVLYVGLIAAALVPIVVLIGVIRWVAE